MGSWSKTVNMENYSQWFEEDVCQVKSIAIHINQNQFWLYCRNPSYDHYLISNPYKCLHLGYPLVIRVRRQRSHIAEPEHKICDGCWSKQVSVCRWTTSQYTALFCLCCVGAVRLKLHESVSVQVSERLLSLVIEVILVCVCVFVTHVEDSVVKVRMSLSGWGVLLCLLDTDEEPASYLRSLVLRGTAVSSCIRTNSRTPLSLCRSVFRSGSAPQHVHAVL